MSVSLKTIEMQKEKISNILNEQYNWIFNDVSFVGSGVDHAVYSINEINLGNVVIRTPWRDINNENTALSMIKEEAISTHCERYGIPVPRTHLLHISEEIRFLVSDFIVTDEIDVSSNHIGNLISNIHAIPVHNLFIIDQGSSRFTKIIAERMLKRLNQVNHLLKTTYELPKVVTIQEVLDTTINENCLLHLDVRKPNILCREGEIKAIIDWDNAFIGDPIAEIMRIIESNEIHAEEFMEGYRDSDILDKT